MRGRPGQSRYKTKRSTPIPFKEFVEIIENTEDLEEKSLLAFLFYTGARVSEIVGDSAKRYKKLSQKGRALKEKGILPRDWIKRPEHEGLWIWVERPPIKGLTKEDFEIDKTKNVLNVNLKPVKRGRRIAPLELPLDLPYMDLILKQWRKTKKGEKIWRFSPWQVWDIVKRASNGRLYPHAFRFSKATLFARDPNIAVSDMQYWFGWARASTADRYILPARGSEKIIRALKREIQQNIPLE